MHFGGLRQAKGEQRDDKPTTRPCDPLTLVAERVVDLALIDALLEIAEVNPSELIRHRLLSGRAKASDLGRPSHFAPPR